MTFIIMTIMSLSMVSTANALIFTMPGPGQDGSAFLHVGDPPDSPKLWNGEVTALTSNIVSILDVDGPTILDPLWLVLGIPNVGNSYVAPVITSITSLQGNIAAQVGGPGGVWAGSLDPTENVYLSIFGIKGDASQSFTNWNLWQNQINHFTANNYGIFVYEIDMSAGHMVGKDQITITFGSALDAGTYALSIAQITKNGKVSYATTPFTETGLKLKVPEPTSLLLIGMGLLGMGLLRRKN
jgi:hypothetical protein